MGFRFRKSFGKGPLRVTVSKSGVGYSVGGKGFRYTKKASGGTRTTVSIPGTGISYVKDSSSEERNTAMNNTDKNASESSRKCGYCHRELVSGSSICPHCGIDQSDVPGAQKKAPKKPFYKRWWFILIMSIVLLRGCGYIMGAEPTSEEPTTPMVEATLAPTEAPTETQAEATRPPNIPVVIPGISEDTTTYILNTSTQKFHDAGCSSIQDIKDKNKGTFTGTREEIIQKGYEPCGRCNP